MSADFLLEIGTEEIPHWMIPAALDQLRQLDLFGATPRVDATPRRLVVQASGLPERTPDENQIIKGPPLSSGDKAAAGFAKKNGVDLSVLSKAGDYYELRKTVPGRAVAELLAERLPKSVLGIQWPKTMYWTGGKNGPRFIRPIRWIVALLGSSVIPFEIASVKAGNVSKGHRKLGAASIPVTTANYETELRKNFVILSAEERREKIRGEITALGAKPDADLLETLTYITEYPTAIKGDFDAAYLTLPAEVLTTVMRHHQKYFSVESAPGKLANHFVAVMNTSGDPEGLVKKGNERVLRARFNDARFFFDVDQQKKLADRLPDLAKVTFQAKLGSYLEKTERTVALVKELGGNADAQRAAQLAKCDLTTEMVKEFTDLQGIIGGLYARHQGEPEPVAKAIYDHYKPLNMEDGIPESTEGQILAIADRLDTLREFFRIGLAPTGSKDPFALRRAAQGLLKIIVNGPFNPRLNVKELCGDSEELAEFMSERVRYYFTEVEGYPYDEVEAVLAATPSGEQQKHQEGTLSLLKDDIFKLRLKALNEVRGSADFDSIIGGLKRIRRILRQGTFTPEGRIDASEISLGPERNLYDAYRKVVDSANVHFPRRECTEFLMSVAETRSVIDAFFDGVMVMDEVERNRIRRLELLRIIDLQFNALADFSKLVIPGDNK